VARSASEQGWRILLVSARERAPEELEDALTSQGVRYQLSWVSQSALALDRAQDMIPDFILVDDKLDGTNAIPLIKLLVARLPGAIVLLLIEPEAITSASQAVLAGARGFLIKPLDANELVTTLEQLDGQRQERAAEPEAVRPANGHVIVFCASKGGTGRTTLAINTAIGLRQISQKPVVLVDADYAAPALDVALNLSSERNIFDLLPRLAHIDEELVSGVLVPHTSGIQVLLAPPGGLSEPISLPQIQQILVLLKRMFTWVIIDLGLPLDEAAFAFLDGAERIVVSVLPEMVALRNARLMLDVLREQGYAEDKIWLVGNRATMKGGVSTADIEGRLRMKLQYLIPDDPALATHSVHLGVPVLMSYPRSPLARAIRGFAQRLDQSLRPQAELLGPVTSPRGGFMGRWLRHTSATSV